MSKVVGTKSVRGQWLALLALNLAYAWGGKKSNGFKGEGGKPGIDCSGGIEVLTAQIPELATLRGKSSTEQLDELARLGFERVPYSEACKDRSSNVFYIAGFNVGGRDRHIWGVQNGWTLESHYPNGPHARPATYPTLKNNVQRCFRISSGA